MPKVRKLSTESATLYTPGGRIAEDIGLAEAYDTIGMGRYFDAKLEESATTLTLRVGFLEDVPNPEGYLVTQFTEAAVTQLDKNTGEVTESDADKILELLETSQYFQDGALVSTLIFAVNVAAIKNHYAYDEIKKSGLLEKVRHFSYTRVRTPFLYWMLVYELDFFEKILKTNREIIDFHIDTMPVKAFLREFKENAIPSGILKRFNDMCTEYSSIKSSARKVALNVIHRICNSENPNNAALFVDWCCGWLKLMKAANISTYNISFDKFFESIAYLLSHNYESKRLLDYLTRQAFYYGSFVFPEDQIVELVDYLQLCQENGFKIEQYPAHIKKAHNCIVSNSNTYKTLSSESVEAFKAICAKNAAKYATRLDEYVVVFPKEPRDLFLEGAALNHCVGGYVRPVIKGQSIVAFLRKKDEPDKSLYTIEISNGKVIQAKGNYNADVGEDVMDVIHRIEKRWALRSIKALKKGEND